MKENRMNNTCCEECGLGIYRRPFQIKKGHVYCSIICSNVRNKKRNNCSICKKEISTKRKTCSKRCSNISRTGIKYGQGRPKSLVVKYRALRGRIFDARENKCNRCGYSEYPEILVLHHIIERSNGGTDEDNNLEILCPNCHTLHHYTTKTKMEDSMMVIN